MRSGKAPRKMEKEGSRAAEVIDFEEDRMEEEVDAVEQKDASSDRALSDSDEMVEQQVGSTSDRNVDLIDEADDTEEGPFVKVEYVRGRRTNGRRREELARLRAIAVDRAKDFFLGNRGRAGVCSNGGRSQAKTQRVLLGNTSWRASE